MKFLRSIKKNIRIYKNKNTVVFFTKAFNKKKHNLRNAMKVKLFK